MLDAPKGGERVFGGVVALTILAGFVFFLRFATVTRKDAGAKNKIVVRGPLARMELKLGRHLQMVFWVGEFSASDPLMLEFSTRLNASATGKLVEIAYLENSLRTLYVKRL